MQVVSGPVGRERVHYEAPAAGSVDREMRAFLAWFNEPGLDRPRVQGGARPSVVRDHPSVRRRQRPHRARHRRHGAGALGEKPAALLQHVGANPASSGRPTTTSWKRHRRATSTSRAGSNGSSAAWIVPLTAPRPSWPLCSIRRGFGRSTPGLPERRQRTVVNPPARRRSKGSSRPPGMDQARQCSQVQLFVTSTISCGAAFWRRTPPEGAAQAIRLPRRFDHVFLEAGR